MSSFSIHSSIISPSRKPTKIRHNGCILNPHQRVLFVAPVPIVSPTESIQTATSSLSFQRQEKKIQEKIISPLRSLWTMIVRAGRGGAVEDTTTTTAWTTLTPTSLLNVTTANPTVDTTTTNTTSENKKNSTFPQESPIALHSYYHTFTNTTIYGFGLSKAKFKSFLTYTFTSSLQQQKDYRDDDKEELLSSSNLCKPLVEPVHTINDSTIVTQYIQQPNQNQTLRKELRQYWFQRQLITDRTEVLAEYQSDSIKQQQQEIIQQEQEKDENNNHHHKRGGFNDLLYSYSKRFTSILQDEEESDILIPTNYSTTTTNNNNSLYHTSLIDWLISDYGKEETNQLLYTRFKILESKEQVDTMQLFLTWFRNQFPYYYDRCDACGTSFREEKQNNSKPIQQEDNNNNMVVQEENDIITRSEEEASSTRPKANNNNNNNDNNIFSSSSTTLNDDTISNCGDGISNRQEEKEEEEEVIVVDPVDDDDDDDGTTFLGYVYPSLKELNGKASRTELFRCHKCHHYTRFPRYNTVSSIIGYKRGRCGEYSMLLFRILRALGHEARWIVDWADHVWAECFFPDSLSYDMDKKGRWVHLDPCEAAVDQPLLYQSWGKKQTYIFAFYADKSSYLETISSIPTLTDEPHDDVQRPIIEDVTSKYTNDDLTAICQRRDENLEVISSSVIDVENYLRTTIMKKYS